MRVSEGQQEVTFKADTSGPGAHSEWRGHESWSLTLDSCFASPCCYCLVTQSCLTLCDPVDCSMQALSVPYHLLKFAQGHVCCIGDAIQASHPLKPFSSALNLSQHQGLCSESAVCIRWPKYWRFSFSISPSYKHSGLISLEIDWFDLLVVQETPSSFF